MPCTSLSVRLERLPSRPIVGLAFGRRPASRNITSPSCSLVQVEQNPEHDQPGSSKPLPVDPGSSQLEPTASHSGDMMNVSRRTLLVGALGPAAMLVACGSTTPAVRPVRGAGCYKNSLGRYGHRPICTSHAVPVEVQQENAKDFAPISDMHTVFVYRGGWSHLVSVAVTGNSIDGFDLIPQSFARLRLQPGNHRLTANWSDGATHLDPGPR